MPNTHLKNTNTVFVEYDWTKGKYVPALELISRATSSVGVMYRSHGPNTGSNPRGGQIPKKNYSTNTYFQNTTGQGRIRSSCLLRMSFCILIVTVSQTEILESDRTEGTPENVRMLHT